MEQNTFLTCLAITFIPMKSLKNVAETFKVGFWILPQILFMARDMFFGSSLFFSESIFFSFTQPLYVNIPAEIKKILATSCQKICQ